jgi:hypothetical protein
MVSMTVSKALLGNAGSVFQELFFSPPLYLLGFLPF